MKNDPEHLRFFPPCDLCGSFRFERLTIGGESAHRCQACRLVRLDVPRQQHSIPNRRRIAALERGVRSHIKSIGKEKGTILLLGPAAAQLAEKLAKKENLTIHLLTESETPAPRGVIRHVLSIEQAAFIPDLFDLVVADITAQPIFPSLLLQKARLWLKPERTLLLVADNSASLLATIYRRPWMKGRGASLTHLLTSYHLERYAGRSGFVVRQLRTASSATAIAGVITKRKRPRFLANGIGVLLSGVARLLSGGEVMVAQLEKRGPVQIPLTKPLPERDQAAGLAHAMYVVVKREQARGFGRQ